MVAARHDAESSVRVPHARSSVHAARRAFAEYLESIGLTRHDRDDAVLVLSELLSNAVRHASPLANGEIWVRWAVGDDSVHVAITDGGGPTWPQLGSAAVSSLGGRGLEIVRQVSSRWGVTVDHGAVTVWADLPRSGFRYHPVS
jgi:anti-sigma regulatory factor (Ser/Thr protein kinase)